MELRAYFLSAVAVMNWQDYWECAPNNELRN